MTKSTDRRQVILDHALELFVKKGYHQTRTSDITDRMGIAAGTLFNYFKKKEDVISTLYLQLKNEFTLLLDTDKSSDEHIYTYLKKGWMNIVLWGVNNFNKVLFLLQMDDSPVISEQVKKQSESKGMKYTAIYQEGIDQGFLKEMPIMLAVRWYYRAMVTTIDYLVKFEANATETRKKEIAEMAFNNYLYGIRV